jgi:beta-fructofuranosidase
MRSKDRYFPLYHFVADNWMSHPTPYYWKGEYHVFYLHNPDGSPLGPMQWGHAVSSDLRDWKLLPFALTPDPDGPDQEGCLEGCVFRDNKTFHLLYAALPQIASSSRVLCRADSPDLISWTKYEGNPVAVSPADGESGRFGGPCVWKEADTWLMLLGTASPSEGDSLSLYSSRDKVQWSRIGPFSLDQRDVSAGGVGSPDFFTLLGKQLLLTSGEKTRWSVGSYRDRRFSPLRSGAVDSGVLRAAKTMGDERGRRLLFGWIPEERPESDQWQAGWSGALSLPRELAILSDGSLGAEPAPELDSLRGRHWRFEKLSLSGNPNEETLLFDGVEGDALEIVVRFATTTAREYGVVVLASPDLKEKTEIPYDRENGSLFDAALPLRRKSDALTLRIYVDRSIVECFANGRVCYTLRSYPKREDCLSVGAFARGGKAVIDSVDVWEIGSG